MVIINSSNKVRNSEEETLKVCKIFCNIQYYQKLDCWLWQMIKLQFQKYSYFDWLSTNKIVLKKQFLKI